MPKLFNKQYSKSDLYRRSSNISQLASIDEMTFNEGKSAGMRLYHARSVNGLEFTMVPDKCLDISSLSYKGINVSLLTRNGVCSPQYMFPVDGEFDRYFAGGMLWTCGLKNGGMNYVDSAGHFHHLHGRIGTQPTESSWKKCEYVGDDYVMSAGAVSRDTVIEGYNLELVRHIKTTLSKPEIEITDSIENIDCNETDYLLLYHFNFGFPFLSEDLELHFPDAASPAQPRTEAAKLHLSEWRQISSPIDNVEENVIFHFPQPDKFGIATITLENTELKIGAYIQYETKHLPYLVEWKCLRSGEYALGIEPSNNLIGGMENERASGNAKKIAPGEKHVIRLKIGFYDIA